ncbi:tRNA threonylcarbamoyladenosine dehydratase [Betaproteobacteria bacterium]|nr:tRNA threonylcarbamoyladenosine dehydratase [Betaproteobacteria bacterium]GHU47474.1 tRNA threonylcarbamoyladenosine dehydratase [Betaproteobacteria bacterium]
MRETADLERRFGGVSRLYGAVAAARFQAAHVGVVGVGGVGSWVVEALARNRVGRLTLIDLDMVAESNTNRQIQALDGNYGKAKIEVMAERIQSINPECRVHCIEDFVTPENVAQMLADDFSIVIDAIDQTRVKAAMIAHCKRQGIPIVTVGAAGGQIDPTQIRRADLSQTTEDPLLAKVRSQLRREYAFPKAPKKFGIPAIYSVEPLRYPTQACESGNNRDAPQGLNCAGFGSSVCVTAAMGLAACAVALEIIGAL